MMTDIPFTPTQRRILAVLSDGLPHPVDELVKCLNDETATKQHVAPHLTAMRKLLGTRGETIANRYDRGTICYMHVRLLHSPSMG
jgi:hypothetical protein